MVFRGTEVVLSSCRSTLVFLIFLVTAQCAAGDDSPASAPLSNLEVMRELALELGSRAGAMIPVDRGDTVTTIVRPTDAAWYIEAALLRGIADRGYLIRTGEGGELLAEFGIANLSVTYSDARSGGVFGETVVDRNVHVTVSAKILDATTSDILFQDDLVGNRRDTVAMSAIRSLENPNIPVTQGEIPTEGFFSGVAGPLIVLGALGIAVYLLFHVRS